MNRVEVLNALKGVVPGLSKKPLIEQSDQFVFTKDEVITFDGDILARRPNPLDVEIEEDFAINAQDLLALLEKMPDKELTTTVTEQEILLSGKRRQAGITFQEQVYLQYNEVPTPSGWKEVPKELLKMLLQAARTCGRDQTQPKTTSIHVTPNHVEACDNNRYFKAIMETNFQESLLLPALPILSLRQHTITEVAVAEDWVHFKTKTGETISIRCYRMAYLPEKELEAMHDFEGEVLHLPKNLGEITERAGIMIDSLDEEAHIILSEGLLVVKTEKIGGWYEEKKRVRYKGPKVSFDVDPIFLCELLERSREVIIGKGQMKLEAENILFAVSLRMIKD